MEEIWERRTGGYIKGVVGRRKDKKKFKLENSVTISYVYFSYFYVSSEVSSITRLKPWWLSTDS